MSTQWYQNAAQIALLACVMFCLLVLLLAVLRLSDATTMLWAYDATVAGIAVSAALVAVIRIGNGRKRDRLRL